jgi:hypothetical protein
MSALRQKTVLRPYLFELGWAHVYVSEDAAKRANLQRTVPMNWDRGSPLIPCKEMMTASDPDHGEALLL